MFHTCINHHNRSSYTNSSRLKYWHFLDLVCSIHVVTITTWLSFSNRKCLKKRHFPNLICTVRYIQLRLMKKKKYFNYAWWDIRCFRSRLKKWTFLDLVCSLDLVTITTGLIHSDRSPLKKWNFLDPLCSVHVITITTELNYCKRSSFLKVAFSGPIMFSTCICHYNPLKL